MRVLNIDRQRFSELVSQALDEMPADLMAAMNNVVVVAADDSADGNLLGLYEGYPLTARGWDYDGSGALPDQITVYREPILAICDTEDEVAEQVRVTVIHEFAHHFGIDDNQLHELGWD